MWIVKNQKGKYLVSYYGTGKELGKPWNSFMFWTSKKYKATRFKDEHLATIHMETMEIYAETKIPHTKEKV